MVTMQDFVAKLLTLSDDDLKLIGEGLVWYSPAQAERLKNYIAFAQQEVDAFEMKQKQFEEASRMADMDAQYYGASI